MGYGLELVHCSGFLYDHSKPKPVTVMSLVLRRRFEYLLDTKNLNWQRFGRLRRHSPVKSRRGSKTREDGSDDLGGEVFALSTHKMDILVTACFLEKQLNRHNLRIEVVKDLCQLVVD